MNIILTPREKEIFHLLVQELFNKRYCQEVKY